MGITPQQQAAIDDALGRSTQGLSPQQQAAIDDAMSRAAPQGMDDLSAISQMDPAAIQAAHGGDPGDGTLNFPEPRSLLYNIGDNIIGFDDGVMTPGERFGALTAMGVESGTFGLVGEEANAYGDTLFGRDYDESLQRRRAIESQVEEQNPALSLAARIAGGIAGPGLGVAKATAAGGGLLARMAYGAGTGAVAAGTEAFMEGEGGFSNRVNRVPIAAGFGAALGGAVAPIEKAARVAWKNFGPGSAAASRVAQHRLRLDETGARMVANAVDMDAPVIARNLSRAGDDAVNAMAGPNTTSLLDLVVNRPGPAASRASAAIQGMSDDAYTRFSGSLDDILGIPQGVARAQRGIMQSTAPLRREAYSAAYSRPINYASDAGQGLEETLKRVPEDVLRGAERLMRTNGEASAQIMARIADDGTVIFDQMPDVRQIDYITRALRDKGGFGVGEGMDQARSFAGLASDLRRQLDDLVPEYRAARAAGQDAIANREAVEFGESLFSSGTKMDVVEDAVEGMTDAELQYARQGLRSYIDEVMANVKGTNVDRSEFREIIRPLKEITSRAGRTKLSAILGDDAAARLAEEADRAYAVLDLRGSVVRGSPTAPRQFANELLEEAVPPTAMEALEDGRGLSGAMMQAGRPLLSGEALTRAARKDAVMQGVGDLLLSPVGTTQLPIQNLGLSLRAGDQSVDAAGRVARGLAASLGGGAIGAQTPSLIIGQ